MLSHFDEKSKDKMIISKETVFLREGLYFLINL